MSSDATIFFAAWILWMLCTVSGFVVGSRKDQGMPGLIWSFLLGPLGLIVAICLPDRSDKVRDELTPRQLEALRRSLKKGEKTPASAPTERRPRPAQPELIRVAQNGIDLGEFEEATIREMIQAGRLTLHDYFYDPKAGQWVELGTHPKFA